MASDRWSFAGSFDVVFFASNPGIFKTKNKPEKPSEKCCTPNFYPPKKKHESMHEICCNPRSSLSSFARLLVQPWIIKSSLGVRLKKNPSRKREHKRSTARWNTLKQGCVGGLLGSCWLKWRRFLHGMFPVFFFGGDIEHPYYEQAKNKLLLGGGFKQFSKNVHPLWKNQLGVIQPPTNWNLVLNFNWIM